MTLKFSLEPSCTYNFIDSLLIQFLNSNNRLLNKFSSCFITYVCSTTLHTLPTHSCPEDGGNIGNTVHVRKYRYADSGFFQLLYFPLVLSVMPQKDVKRLHVIVTHFLVTTVQTRFTKIIIINLKDNYVHVLISKVII
jgi:hypothetical protein